MYSLVAAIVFAQLAQFSCFDVVLESQRQHRYSKQQYGAILSVSFYQTHLQLPGFRFRIYKKKKER